MHGLFRKAIVAVFLMVTVPFSTTQASGPMRTVSDTTDTPQNQLAAAPERLNELFTRLQLAEAGQPAQGIAQQIWQVWLKPNDTEIDDLMNQVLQEMTLRRFENALTLLDVMVEKAPNYSEAWNKRATVYYILRRYEDSLADIDKTLALEPRHFGALAGEAMIRIARGENKLAVDAVRRALEVYPTLPGAAHLLLQAGGGESQDPT